MLQKHSFFTLLACFASMVLCAQNNINLQLRATRTWPDRKLAGVWGYTAPNGTEYALVGSSKGLIIVDVSNPDNPVEITAIPGPESKWREVKVYKKFAFVSSEAQNGLQIVDLTNLPATNLNVKTFTGQGAVAGTVLKSHTLQIDTTKGFLYYHGASATGALVFDLNNSPWSPVYVGKYSHLGYTHDGYVDNDTLYAAHIYGGLVSIADMSDKQNPQVLGSVNTPAKFPHNTWPSEDRTTLFVSDEKTPSYLTAYDMTDPADLTELDRLALHDNGTQSLIHNVYTRQGYAYASWYTDGVAIIDVHRPQNMVPVGIYDTWPGPGNVDDAFGCWDVYPFFNSNTVLATNIPDHSTWSSDTAKLFVFTPQLVRACYVEGVVKDACSGVGLAGVTVTINTDNPHFTEKTNQQGLFKSGHYEAGNYILTFSKPGYPDYQLPVTLEHGVVTQFEITLEAPGYMSVSGDVIGPHGEQAAFFPIWLCSAADQIEVITDISGHYSAPCLATDEYDVVSGIWGTYLPNAPLLTANSAPGLHHVKEGYYDNFSYPFGWKLSSNWVRTVPAIQQWNGETTNPGHDAPGDSNRLCMLTGNGASDALSDKAQGTSLLLSPPIQIANFNNPILSFDYWFYKKSLDSTVAKEVLYIAKPFPAIPNVFVILDSITVSDTVWRQHTMPFWVSEIISEVKFILKINNNSGQHLIEAGIDRFRITDGIVPAYEPAPEKLVQVNPNPSGGQITITTDAADVHTLLITNTAGQTVFSMPWPAGNKHLTVDTQLPPGIYFLHTPAHKPVKIIISE